MLLTTDGAPAQHEGPLKPEEEIRLQPPGVSRLAFGAHAFDNQHQYLFHVTEHKMRLHQRDYFRKEIVEQA